MLAQDSVRALGGCRRKGEPLLLPCWLRGLGEA